MKKWNGNRGLFSLLTSAGFLIMGISGLVLFIMPAGRVAYWTDWRFLWLSKTQWDNIHILGSVLFLVAGACHVYLNWKPLVRYIKGKTGGLKASRELIVAVSVTGIIVIAGIAPFPPLNWILDLSETASSAWIVSKDYEPPFGHAELLSLRSFSKKMDIPLEQAVETLKEKGISVGDPSRTLEEIARENKMSPVEIYRLIQSLEPEMTVKKSKRYTPESVETTFAGTGIGNKTLEEICQIAGVSNGDAVRRLKAKGFSMKRDEPLRAAAQRQGVRPMDLLKVMLLNADSGS